MENTSGPGNLRDNLRNLKFNVQAIGKSNLGSTYAPGGHPSGARDLSQLQAMLKLPNFDINNYNQQHGYHYNHSGNRSSLMGTLKGGLGIMQNLSNADMPDNLNDSMNQMDLALCGLGT